MKQILKRAATGVGVLTLAVAGATMVPSVANAASYNGVCGSSYGVIDAQSLPGVGTVYLTYSSSTGKNCVVTVRDNPGTKLPMAARVSLASAPWISDSGNFGTYAGPVYVSAAHSCVDWGGEINGVYAYEYNSHCS